MLGLLSNNLLLQQMKINERLGDPINVKPITKTKTGRLQMNLYRIKEEEDTMNSKINDLQQTWQGALKSKLWNFNPEKMIRKIIASNKKAEPQYGEANCKNKVTNLLKFHTSDNFYSLSSSPIKGKKLRRYDKVPMEDTKSTLVQSRVLETARDKKSFQIHTPNIQNLIQNHLSSTPEPAQLLNNRTSIRARSARASISGSSPSKNGKATFEIEKLLTESREKEILEDLNPDTYISNFIEVQHHGTMFEGNENKSRLLGDQSWNYSPVKELYQTISKNWNQDSTISTATKSSPSKRPFKGLSISKVMSTYRERNEIRVRSHKVSLQGKKIAADESRTNISDRRYSQDSQCINRDKSFETQVLQALKYSTNHRKKPIIVHNPKSLEVSYEVKLQRQSMATTMNSTVFRTLTGANSTTKHKNTNDEKQEQTCDLREDTINKYRINSRLNNLVSARRASMKGLVERSFYKNERSRSLHIQPERCNSNSVTSRLL